MGSRASSALRAVGVALLAGLLACAEPTPTRLEVVGRLWGPTPVAEAAPSQPLLWGAQSRHAVSGAAIEAVLPRPASRIVFSLGAGPEAARGRRARFAIDVEAGDGWREVWSETLGGRVTGWQDRSLDLAAEGAARRLRLRSGFEAGARPGEPGPFWGSVAFLAAPERPRPERPDVVFVWLDTLGASHLGAYGGLDGVSPHLDRFLAESFSFPRTFAQYGQTLVSSASLFSGLHPGHHGVYPGRGVRQFPSLVEAIAADGYLTAAVTEGGYLSSELGFGGAFDRYDNGTPMAVFLGAAPRTFQAAGDWLEDVGAGTRSFLFVHTYEVHAPYLPKRPESLEIVERVSPGDRSYPSREFQLDVMMRHADGRRPIDPALMEHLKALHYATIAELDAELGAFLARLEALGRARDTLVVVAADHGDQFGEQGRIGHTDSLHNRVLHVPLAFRWPARFGPGESRDPVQVVDVMPTVLGLLGLALPDGLDGRSLAPLLLGAGAVEPRPAFAELRSSPPECARQGLAKGCSLERFAVQTGRFKLVESSVPPGSALYDLANDPLETRDVGADHPEELARHRALLDAYRAGAGRPLAPAEPAPLEPATRERLEALGYLE